MSGHGWARRAILTSIGVGALLASGVSRARPRLESEWLSREIAVDGSLDEWEGRLRFVEGAKLSLGIHNDGEYLYLAVYSRNPQVVRQIALRGLELKLKGKEEPLHIRFPVGLAESGPRPPSQRGGDEAEDRELRGLVVSYHKKFGDEISFIPGAYFANMYNTREQVNRDLRDGLKRVSETVGDGYRPKSVVAGFLAAENLRCLAEKEGIHVCQGNIWSQYAVDNGDGEGSICYPYYPSREHFCKPARRQDDFIDCVNLDGWTVDFLCARIPGARTVNGEHWRSRQGVGPIETLLDMGTERGLQAMLAATAAHFDDGFARNGFPGGFITCPLVSVGLLLFLIRPAGFTGTVVEVKLILFNDPDQQFGVSRVGSVTGFLEAAGPGLVIIDIKVEQGSVTVTGSKKERMVAVGILRRIVLPETFVLLVVIHPVSLPAPGLLAFDPEMVVGVHRQLAGARSRFQQSLRQGDAGGDAVLDHLRHGKP